MTPELRRSWVEALRSGKYPQGVEALCQDGAYCCLGVLADLNGDLVTDERFAPGRKGVVTGEGRFDYSTGMLPVVLVEKYGMELHQMDQCITWNDSSHLTFAEIADNIENGKLEETCD